MKRVLLMMVFLAFAGVSSCEKSFESSVELAVNDETLTLGAAAGTCVITVYSNTDWRASLAADGDWARISVGGGDGMSASGLGFVHFFFEANGSGTSREAVVTLQSKNKTVSVVLTQSGN
ncbi:MAG: BACON domain-containing protein [Alistipes sp.]|nr:BACON domain-containing protein [Alistipes sp.]